WIIFWRPGDLFLAGHHIGLETPYNALLVMWFGFILCAASFFKIPTYGRPEIKTVWRSRIIRHAILGTTALICLLPLFIPLFRLALGGEYPRQSILWKTHRNGANILSLFMPNPMHALWGPPVFRWFTNHGLIVQDEAASLGWVALGLLFFARPW